MERVVLLALEPDPERLTFLDMQLTQRYASDYRVECLQDPDQALQTLIELAGLGEDVALVLASNLDSRAGWLLEHVRRGPYPLETSMPGVFAAGDVGRSSIKRVASAVGERSNAIRLVQELLACDPFVAVGVSFSESDLKSVITAPNDEGVPRRILNEKLGLAVPDVRVSGARPPSDAPMRRH